jgi:hypothetical protein
MVSIHLRRVLAVLAIGLAVEGCDGCRCSGIVGDVMKRPDDASVERLVRERLKKADEIASTACGVAATGVEATSVEVTQGKLDVPGFGDAAVSGTLIPAPTGGGADAGTASPAPKGSTALVCEFVVRFYMIERGGEWVLESLTLAKVTTPGVSWTPPPSSGGDD